MADSISKHFGAVLRVLRTEAGLTQEALAELAGIHPTYIGLVERGVRNCSLDIADQIAKGRGAPLSEMLAQAELKTKGGRR